MRLIKQNIERDGSGTVTLFPEEPEDMWHAYNLIAATDLLRASAIRRVTTESTTGSTSSTRIHTTLSIRVSNLDFDPQAGQLHVSGRVAEENKYVKAGAYHTLDLALQRNFTLEKAEGWDSVAIEAVKEACRQDGKEGIVPAVVMDEGTAVICLISEFQTVVKQRVETGISRKRTAPSSTSNKSSSSTPGIGSSNQHDASLQKFYALLLESLARHVDLALPRPLLLASPGFVASNFLKFIITDATRRGDKAILGNKSNFLVINTSSGHLHALHQVMQSPAVQNLLSDTKYAKETQVMDEFMKLLRRDDEKAWYGPREVEKAVERLAVGKGGGILLISNALFRSQEIGVRKRYVGLVERVREQGGEVRILSGDHESGRRLEGLGGVAAILTFPLGGLDEDDKGEEAEGEVDEREEG